MDAVSRLSWAKGERGMGREAARAEKRTVLCCVECAAFMVKRLVAAAGTGREKAER